MQYIKLLTVAVVSLMIFSSPSVTTAQRKIPRADYDHYALAITSITEIAAEATRLADVPQRVKILIEAAKILHPAKRDEAVRLLEVVLNDLKEWGSSDTASWHQRNIAAHLRNEALAVYALIDSEKALVRQKELQSSEASTSGNNSTALNFKTSSWRAHFSDRQTAADQTAKLALSIIDAEPDRALGLVVQSLRGGVVSGVLFNIVEKLIQNGNRTLLDRLENKISQALAMNVSLDPSSLTYASTVGLVDKDMPRAAKNAFANFFMRSLQAWTMVAKEPGIDSYYIIDGFRAFSGNIRFLISQYAPNELLEFDLLLDQTAPFVPDRMRSLVQRLVSETFSDPKERLDDILKDPVADRRDRRLLRLVSELLRSETIDSEKRFDLAADAVHNFSDADVKSAFTDLLTTARIDALIKRKKIIEAQELAASLSSEETRAWALLAVATVAAKEDKVLGFESISKALKALDAAAPSPHKTELALLATAMLVKDDSRRAFETLLTAVKYANSSVAKDSSRTKPPVAFGLEMTIGPMQTRLGVVPLNLGDIRIDTSLSSLALTDWFRADQIVNSIRDSSLRLLLKLQFAGTVLTKSRKNQATSTSAN